MLGLRVASVSWLLIALMAPMGALRAAEDDTTAPNLEVGIQTFDVRNGKSDPVDRLIGRYFAIQMKRALDQRNRFGQVRVADQRLRTAELVIVGEILEHSATRLHLKVNAFDAAARPWMERHYIVEATLEDYGDLSLEPFAPAFDQIVSDLIEVADTRGQSGLQRIVDTALLRYAGHYSEQFADHVSCAVNQPCEIRRRPARDDPAIALVKRIRDSEYLFTDVVSEHIEQHADRIAPIYRDYRQTVLHSTRVMADYRQSAGSSPGKDYIALRNRYQQFRELKLHQETLYEAMATMRFETGPTVLKLDTQMVELSGSLERQQGDWERLLNEIYRQEIGLPMLD